MRIFFTRPHSEISAAPVPLGMMSLAAYIREQRRGDELRLYDARVHLTLNDELVPLVAAFQPDLLCITSFSLESDIVHNLARRVKRALPNCRVFWGGPYPTSDSIAVVADPKVDIAFIGEGEATFLRILNALDSGESLGVSRTSLFARTVRS